MGKQCAVVVKGRKREKCRQAVEEEEEEKEGAWLSLAMCGEKEGKSVKKCKKCQFTVLPASVPPRPPVPSIPPVPSLSTVCFSVVACGDVRV